MNVLIEAVERETINVDDSALRRSSSSSEEGTAAGSQLEQLRKRVRLEKQAEVRDNTAKCALHVVLEYSD